MAKEIKAKDRKNYRPCRRCGESVHVDLSQCPSCRHFNIAVAITPGENDGTEWLDDVTEEKTQRIQTGPWDPVFGTTVVDDDTPEKPHRVSGIVGSSVILIGGAPGAGKSTLALQLADSVAMSTDKVVLYVSKEEPDGQVKARKLRLKLKSYRKIRMYGINNEADLGALLLAWKPVAVIIDSFKKVAPDPEAQVVFAARLKQYCNELGAIGIIIDHVNKEEDFSGHMANQHEVDTTLLFTVWPDEVRELRTVKNRNGASGVRVCFDMSELGLVYNEEATRALSGDSDDDEEEEFDDE